MEKNGELKGPLKLKRSRTISRRETKNRGGGKREKVGNRNRTRRRIQWECISSEKRLKKEPGERILNMEKLLRKNLEGRRGPEK